jgi:hypothetical protein
MSLQLRPYNLSSSKPRAQSPETSATSPMMSMQQRSMSPTSSEPGQSRWSSLIQSIPTQRTRSPLMSMQARSSSPSVENYFMRKPGVTEMNPRSSASMRTQELQTRENLRNRQPSLKSSDNSDMIKDEPSMIYKLLSQKEKLLNQKEKEIHKLREEIKELNKSENRILRDIY